MQRNRKERPNQRGRNASMETVTKTDLMSDIQYKDFKTMVLDAQRTERRKMWRKTRK